MKLRTNILTASRVRHGAQQLMEPKLIVDFQLSNKTIAPKSTRHRRGKEKGAKIHKNQIQVSML